ncbi:MAG: hypothetical protein L0154_17075 [Chloroflexi bacterium]|nr:hypothetical protein [Chloroflexota bacterium]
MRRLLVIVLVLLVIPISQPVLSGFNDSDAPYIQYYSDYLNAFVIERADGSDSRVLGEGLFPPDAWSVSSHDMKWSPSGEWLAFESELSRRGEIVTHPTKFTVLSADGQRTLETIETLGERITGFYWLSTRDILMVNGGGSTVWDQKPESEIRRTEYFMIDANTDSVISEIEIEIAVPLMELDFAWYLQNRFTQWHEDTEQLIMAYLDPLPRILWVQFLGLDGKISSRQFPLPESEVFNFYLLPDAWLLYPNINEFSEYIMLNLLDDSTYEYQFEALASITQLGDLPYVLIKDAVREVGLESYQWDMANYFLLDLRNFSMTLLGTFPLHSTFRWTSNGTYIVFDFASSIHVYDVEADSFHRRPLFFDQRKQSGVRTYRLREETEELYILSSEVGANAESQDTLYVYNLETGSVEQHDGLPFYSDISSFSLDLTFYLDYLHEDDDKSLIIMSLDDRQRLSLPFSPRNPALDMLALLDWHEEGYWFIVHEAFMGAGGAPFYRWSNIANMDGDERELTYCGVCAMWLPDHIDITKLPDGQATSVLPVATPTVTIQGSGDILWHEDYIKVDGVTYDINSGDIISLPDYDISFSASEDIELTFDGFPYRVEEIWDRVTMNVLVEQSTGDIMRRYVYRAAYSDPGKLIQSRNIFIQPSDRSNGLLLIWDMERGEIIANLPIPAVSVSVSPDEEHVALQMAHDQIQVWSLDELLSLGIMVPPREVPLDYDFGIEQ